MFKNLYPIFAGTFILGVICGLLLAVAIQAHTG